MTHNSSPPLPPGPCNAANVTSNLHCGSDTATLSWDAAAGAMAYLVVAHERGSENYISHWSFTTSSLLKKLQCGKVYNLTVIADDVTCNSTGITTVLKTGRRLDSWRD